MSSVKVALMGRPNVGKSSFFNILIRKRRNIVKDQPGVTRDIVEEPADWWGKAFTVVDTGGLTDGTDPFSPLIKEQVKGLLQRVDLLVVIVDARIGLTPEDKLAVQAARLSGKPFVVAVNKVDKFEDSEVLLAEFYELGSKLYPVSFEQRHGVDEVIEWICSQVPESNEEVESISELPRLSVIGKPNVGKSTLFNRLLGQERNLVSPVAGTTVDPIEETLEKGNLKYTLVDTAGLRKLAKRKKADDGVEILASFKSRDTIAKSDIVFLLVDAVEGPTDQDAKLVEFARDNHKLLILVANKIDEAEQKRPGARKWFREKAASVYHFFPDIPIAFVSAKTGTGVDKLFMKTEVLWDKLNIKIPTSRLNDFFYDTIRQAPAPVYGTRNVKFYYLTQTKQQPPSFIAFANQPKGVTPSYRRFLTNRIKENWDLGGVPVRMFIVKKGGPSL